MFRISLNVGILVLFYTVLGGILSYVLHYLFDEHDDEWEKKGILFQVYDVTVELILIGLVGFWTMFCIDEAPPMFHVSKSMDSLVDTYIAGVFFSFSLFLFFDDLSSKIRYIYQQVVDPIIKKHFPTKGSILDGSLRKTEETKNTKSNYQ